jgi:hypothetical protein
MLKALVIFPPQKSDFDMGDLLAIARSSAKSREHGANSIHIVAIKFVEEVKAYVAVYSVADDRKVKANG